MSTSSKQNPDPLVLVIIVSSRRPWTHHLTAITASGARSHRLVRADTRRVCSELHAAARVSTLRVRIRGSRSIAITRAITISWRLTLIFAFLLLIFILRLEGVGYAIDHTFKDVALLFFLWLLPAVLLSLERWRCFVMVGRVERIGIVRWGRVEHLADLFTLTRGDVGDTIALAVWLNGLEDLSNDLFLVLWDSNLTELACINVA